MAITFAGTCLLIGFISKFVDHRLIFSSSFALLAAALFTLDRHQDNPHLLNYFAICLIGCSLAAALVPTIPELIESMKTELRIQSEKQGSILTAKVEQDDESGERRQSELLSPIALFTIQMEQSNLSDKTSALFMMSFLLGQITGPMLGGGLESWKGFDFTAITMVYVCCIIFLAYSLVVFIEWCKRPKYTTLTPVP